MSRPNQRRRHALASTRPSRASAPALALLPADEIPAHLARIPDHALARQGGALDFIERHGLGRPSLLALMSERARREQGSRYSSATPRRPEPLPMLGESSVLRARKNGDRVRALVPGLAESMRTGHDPFGDEAA